MEQSNLKQYIQDQLEADAVDYSSQSTVWKKIEKNTVIKKTLWMKFAYLSFALLAILFVAIGYGFYQSDNQNENDEIIADDPEQSDTSATPDDTTQDQDETEEIEDSPSQSNQVIAEEIDLLLSSINQDIGSLRVENDFEDIGL